MPPPGGNGKSRKIKGTGKSDLLTVKHKAKRKNGKLAELPPHLYGMQWTKGKSGNPNGRPKREHSITNCITEFSKNKAVGKYNGFTFEGTFAQVTAWVAWQQAAHGDPIARQFVTERMEGKVPTKITGTNTSVNIVVNDKALLQEIGVLQNSLGLPAQNG